MNIIAKSHLIEIYSKANIQSITYSHILHNNDFEAVSEQIAISTKEIAIKFAKWRIGTMVDKENKIDGKSIIKNNITDYWELLFEEFLKTL